MAWRGTDVRPGMGYVLLMALWDTVLGLVVQFFTLWILSALLSSLTQDAGFADVLGWVIWAAVIRLPLLIVLWRLQTPSLIGPGGRPGEVVLGSGWRPLPGVHAIITACAVAIPLLVADLTLWKVALLTLACLVTTDGWLYASARRAGPSGE